MGRRRKSFWQKGDSTAKASHIFISTNIFRLKDCDPSKIEELLKGGNAETEVVKSFKNKPNKKRKKKKKGDQGKPDASKDVEMKVEIPKNAAEASSNWASLVRSTFDMYNVF